MFRKFWNGFNPGFAWSIRGQDLIYQTKAFIYITAWRHEKQERNVNGPVDDTAAKPWISW